MDVIKNEWKLYIICLIRELFLEIILDYIGKVMQKKNSYASSKSSRINSGDAANKLKPSVNGKTALPPATLIKHTRSTPKSILTRTGCANQPIPPKLAAGLTKKVPSMLAAVPLKS